MTRPGPPPAPLPSMSRRHAVRLEKFLIACARRPHRAVPITTTTKDPDEPGRLLFSDNVENRYDDGDPSRLDRYVLVSEWDETEGYHVHSFPTRRQLVRELTSLKEDEFNFAVDLDMNRFLHPRWETRVVLK